MDDAQVPGRSPGLTACATPLAPGSAGGDCSCISDAYRPAVRSACICHAVRPVPSLTLPARCGGGRERRLGVDRRSARQRQRRCEGREAAAQRQIWGRSGSRPKYVGWSGRRRWKLTRLHVAHTGTWIHRTSRPRSGCGLPAPAGCHACLSLTPTGFSRSSNAASGSDRSPRTHPCVNHQQTPPTTLIHYPQTIARLHPPPERLICSAKS